MALKIFRGDAPAVAQVDTVQITGNDASTTYTLTVNGKTVSVPGNASGASNTASDLADAWNASTIAEFAEVTASVNTDTITLTADTAGKPFTAAASVSGGSGTIGSVTSVTASDGPYHWSAANFGGSLPADSDTVVIRGNVQILYGLDQSSIQPTLMQIIEDSTGSPIIGLPYKNATGGYVEYRERSLKIGPTTLQQQSRSTRIRIDTGTDQVAAEVTAGTVNIAGSNSSSTLQVFGGTVSVATEAGQTAEFSSIVASGSATVNVSSSTTVATVRLFGTVSALVECALTTLEMQDSPSVVVDGSGTITTANVQGGTLDHRSSGTVSTLNGGGGTVDFRNNLSGVTVTNANVSKGFTIDDRNNRVTWTNAYTIQDGNLRDITHRTGRNVTVKVTAA